MKMKKEYFTNTPGQTKKLAKALAQKLLKGKREKVAKLLALEGDLGGGKTTFLQGFAKGLGIKKKILSPSFVITRKYELRSTKKRRKKSSGLQTSDFRLFFHIDCYRIEKPKEILDLGFKEIISNPKNIVAIEWAERVKKIIPKKAIWIKFDFIDKKKRKITISSK